MQTPNDAKSMAKVLRLQMAERGTNLSHSQCLEIVAKQVGLPDWNTLVARFEIKPETAVVGAKILPDGWIKSGIEDQKYLVGNNISGEGAICIESIKGESYNSSDFATLMQSVLAAGYIDKRLRVSAELKTGNVVGHTTIWLRIDGIDKRVLSFDNLESRFDDGPVAGTSDWQERTIVMDVPETAGSFHYGFLLKGTGRAWVRKFSVECVSSSVSTTPSPMLIAPKNLNFSGRRPTA